MPVLADAKATAKVPPITGPATSYPAPETTPIPQVADLMPEKAPLYQAELPADASPEAAQSEAAQAGATQADLAQADLAQAETSQAGLTSAGDAAQAGTTLIDPGTARIEDTPTVGAEASQAALAQARATAGVQGQLSPESLAANQLNQITSQDSPLMQAARARAAEAANRRGLMNSSLAVGAAQRAMVESATPLALQDAQTSWQQQQLNQTLKHEAIQNDATRQLQASLQNAELQTQIDRANVDRQLTAGMFTTEQHNQISTDNAKIVADFAARNAAAANEMAALNVTQENARAQFNAESANRLAEFNANEANRMAAINSSDANAMAQFNAESANRLAEFNANEANRMAAFNAELATQTSQLNASERNAIRNANAARYAAMQQGNMEEANKHAQFIMQMEMELSKQYLAGEAALSLADLQGRYQAVVSTNASAAQMFEAYFQGIAETLSSNLGSADVASRINVQKRFLEAGMEMLSTISDITFEPKLPADVGAGGGKKLLPEGAP